MFSVLSSIFYVLYFYNKFGAVNFVIILLICVIDNVTLNLCDKFYNKLVQWM